MFGFGVDPTTRHAWAGLGRGPQACQEPCIPDVYRVGDKVRRAVLTGLIAALLAPAAASARGVPVVPTGNSAVNQYVEIVPTAAGGRPSSDIHPSSLGGGTTAGVTAGADAVVTALAPSTARRSSPRWAGGDPDCRDRASDGARRGRREADGIARRAPGCAPRARLDALHRQRAPAHDEHRRASCTRLLRRCFRR